MRKTAQDAVGFGTIGIAGFDSLQEMKEKAEKTSRRE